MGNLTKAQIADNVKAESKNTIQTAKNSISDSKKRIEKAKAEIKCEKSNIKKQKSIIKAAKTATKNAKKEAKNEAKTQKETAKHEKDAKAAEEAKERAKTKEDGETQSSSAPKARTADAAVGKYLYKKTSNDGYVFNLVAVNGQIIATSQTYASLDSCAAGVASVRTNAPIADIEDQTVKDFTAIPCPKFEVYSDASGDYRFRLKAKNGQNIAASQPYKDKNSCLDGIASVKRNAPAPLESEE